MGLGQVCTALSMLTFFINPDRIDTRLQLVVTLFLALVAIQVRDFPIPGPLIPAHLNVFRAAWDIVFPCS